jgi:hypothetical protein
MGARCSHFEGEVRRALSAFCLLLLSVGLYRRNARLALPDGRTSITLGGVHVG